VDDSQEFCLDFDNDSDMGVNHNFDNDSEQVVEEGILIEYTDGPIDLDYSNYTMLPICIEQADEVALDKLIKQGKIPKDGIFYKYLKDFLQVYISPTEYAWDPEVIEFFKTLKWLGGQSTVNMIIGPMWHGIGTGGIFTPETMQPNLGGPSDRTPTKKQYWLYYREWHSKFSFRNLL